MPTTEEKYINIIQIAKNAYTVTMNAHCFVTRLYDHILNVPAPKRNYFKELLK